MSIHLEVAKAIEASRHEHKHNYPAITTVASEASSHGFSVRGLWSRRSQRARTIELRDTVVTPTAGHPVGCAV